MEVRTGYKQTAVGEIPETWEVKPLGRLSEFITSGSRGWARYYSDRGPLFVRSQNIQDGQLDFTDRQCVVLPSRSEGGRTRLKCGDLLITITGNSVGNVAWVNQDLGEAYISQHVGLVRLSEPSCAEYICLFLSPGSPGNKQIWASQTGQSKPGLNLKNLEEFWVALPCQREQREISKALSDVDELVNELDRLTGKKCNLKQAAMQQLLTGQTRLSNFQSNWEVKPLGDVAEISKGRLITEKEAKPGNVPVIAGGRSPAYFHNVPNRIGKTITISASGANAGYVSFFDTEIFASDCSTISEGENYAIEFLYFALQFRQNEIYKAQTGGAQPHIYPSDIRPLMMNIPTEVAEQTAIAAVLTDMDAELAELALRLAKTRDLKRGMMQELLSGKTRLVSPKVTHA